MDDVNVHYNSNKPAQLQAHAYAQGTDIHLGPGQEKHLPHEAWHVVLFHAKPLLVLSGDQLYRMNYRKMLKTHVESGAHATIACLPVDRQAATVRSVRPSDPDARGDHRPDHVEHVGSHEIARQHGDLGR